MRLHRQRGNTGRQLEVEQAHQRLYGSYKPFHQIAVELYDELGTQAKVRDVIERRYNSDISEKTASLWINRGLAERETREPAEALQ